MDEKEKLFNEIESKVKDLIGNSLKDGMKREDLDKAVETLNLQIAKLNDEEIKNLKTSVDNLAEKNKELLGIVEKQGEELKKSQEEKQSNPKSFRDLIEDGIMEKKDTVLVKKNDDNGERLSLKDWFTEKGNQTTPVFRLKSAVDMLESNIVQSNVNTVRLTELDPNRVGIPLTIYPHVLDYMPKKQINRKNMSILVVYTYTDGSGTKTEGSASSKSSFLFKTVEFPSFYIATYLTLSDETLDDLGETMDEIAITAPDKIKDQLDSDVYNSTGDDSSSIAGLRTANKHTDFATTTYTDSVEGANVIDLISKAKLQAEANNYRPTHVIMHPTDVDNLAALKNSFEDSVNDRRVRFDALGNPVSVMGLMIVSTTAITANELIVLDIKQTMLGIRKDMTMEIGYNGTDLTEGQKTVVIKMRAAFGVRDKAAVIYSDDIATDVAAINIAGA